MRTFKNYQNTSGEYEDATKGSDTDPSILTGAAQNMKYLSEASLSSNPLAAHIIANLPSYPLLVKLEIYGLKPEEHIWSMDPTSLTSLTWQLPEARSRDATLSPWDSAAFLVNVVETTCPNLESLDVFCKDISKFRRGLSALPTVSTARVEQYRKVVPSEVPKLECLQHFRFRCGYLSIEQQGAIEKEFTWIHWKIWRFSEFYHHAYLAEFLGSKGFGFHLENLWLTSTPEELDVSK